MKAKYVRHNNYHYHFYQAPQIAFAVNVVMLKKEYWTKMFEK